MVERCGPHRPRRASCSCVFARCVRRFRMAMSISMPVHVPPLWWTWQSFSLLHKLICREYLLPTNRPKSIIIRSRGENSRTCDALMLASAISQKTHIFGYKFILIIYWYTCFMVCSLLLSLSLSTSHRSAQAFRPNFNIHFRHMDVRSCAAHEKETHRLPLWYSGIIYIKQTASFDDFAERYLEMGFPV